MKYETITIAITMKAFINILLFLMYMTELSVASFPNGRCYVRDCSSTPYKLEISTNTRNKFCFVINGKECKETSSNYQCCSKFETDLHKIVLSTHNACNKSVDYVTIDGIRKGGGVFFDLYTSHSELRLTSLKMNYTSAIGKEVCVHIKSPCDTLDRFCDSSSTGTCMMAFFDPLAHTCCPICSFYKANNSTTNETAMSPPQTNYVSKPPPTTQPMPPQPKQLIFSPPPSAPSPECPPQEPNETCGCTCQCQCKN